MILGGGIRVENNFMGKVAISQLDDMDTSSSGVLVWAHANTYYDNKIYLKANWEGGDYGLQSLNLITGSWCNLTSTTIGKPIYGFETSGSNLYTVSSYRVPTTGSATTIDIIPYTPLTDTWGTKRTFYHNYNQDTRVCMSGSMMYIAYEYANTSGSYTWHLMSYNISNDTHSSDLNFEVNTINLQQASFDIQSGADSIIAVGGSMIYKYNPITDITENISMGYWYPAPRNNDSLMKYNNNIYRTQYISLTNNVYLQKIDISASTTSASYINLHENLRSSGYDNNGNGYTYGAITGGTYPSQTTNGHTYKITLP
jgi:hypothetical protein